MAKGTSPQRILVSRGDQLGDTLLTTLMIEPLRERFPDAELVWLVKKAYFPFFEDHPDVDTLIEDPLPYRCSFRHWKSILGLARTIRGKKCDVFIGSWETPRYGLIAALAGISRRIGHGSNFWNRLFYTTTIKINFRDFFLHKADYNLSLLKPLGIKVEDEPTKLLTNPIQKEEFSNRYPSFRPGQCLALHMDAGNPIRMLLPFQFEALIKALVTLDLQVVLFGSAMNLKTTEDITARLAFPASQLLNLTTQLSLGDIKVLMSQSQLVVGADSGPVHMAAALGVPVVVYYMNRIQNAFHWGPWRTPHRIVSARHGCVDICSPTSCDKTQCREGVSVSELVEAAKALLANPASLSLPAPDRWRWAQTTLQIAVVDNESAAQLRGAIRGLNLRAEIIPRSMGWKPLGIWLSDLNVNLICIPKNRDFFAMMRLGLARIVASNRCHFYPQIVKVDDVGQLLEFLRRKGVDRERS